MGLPELVDGADVDFDFHAATLNLEGGSTNIPLNPLPDFLKRLILDGGLVPHLEKRFQREESGQ